MLLLKIIQNIARTLNKKELRYKTVDMDAIYLAENYDPYSEIDIELDLERLFKKTDYKNYVIAVLAFRRGRTQDEIGRMLGISKSAVCQRMTKIRAIIENNLKNR